MIGTRTADTPNGGYRLDRSYRVGLEDADVLDVAVIREPTQGASRAVVDCPAWDASGMPVVRVVELAAENWYWGTTPTPVDVLAMLGPIADMVARLAADALNSRAGQTSPS